MTRRRQDRKSRRQGAAARPVATSDVRAQQAKPPAAVPPAALLRSYRLAIVLFGMTTLAIWTGALVTTFGAGMAAPDWPRTGGLDLIGSHSPFWQLGPRDALLEGGHRLLGVLLGTVAITLLIRGWRHDRRRSWRILVGGTGFLLVAVLVLGVTRACYDSSWSALLHAGGSVLLLSLFVPLAVAQSPTWCQSASAADRSAGRGLVRLAAMTTFFAVVQVTLGTFVRHYPIAARPDTFRLLAFFHLGIATVVVAHSALIAWWCGVRRRAATTPLRWATWCLVAAVALQIGLGAGTWIVRFGWPTWLDGLPGVAGYTILADGLWATQLATAHVTNAVLVLAATVWFLVAAVRGNRVQE